MISVRFLPQAEAELIHEVEYYSNAKSGIGIRFRAAVEASLERASRHPLGGAPSPNGMRTVLVKSFLSASCIASVNENCWWLPLRRIAVGLVIGLRASGDG